jgi:hypothetical protein
MDRTWFSLVWVTGLLMAVCLCVVGCTRDTEPKSDMSEVRSESSDPASGVRVVVSVERAEIETVDRLEVAIEVVRPAGMGIGWTEPDWDAAGWERVDRVDQAARVLEGGLIAERAVVTLEPFLDGDYEVPAVSVAVGERSVATTPIGVTVVSVLETDDPGTMSEALPAVAAEPETTRSTGLVVAAVAVALGAFVVFWRLMGIGRGGSDDEAPGPVESLRMAAEGRFEGSEALTRVHRAIDRLDAERAGMLRPLAARCERARFGPGGGEDARAIAREALGLLGTSQGVETGGGA